MDTHFAARLAEVLNSREFERFNGMFAEDFVNHQELAPKGLQGFKQFWSGMTTGLPDLHATLEDSLVASDRIAARYTLRGTHRSSFLGLEATNRRIEMKTFEIWRFEEDLVVEHWDSVNTLEVLQQLGVLPGNQELFAPSAA